MIKSNNVYLLLWGQYFHEVPYDFVPELLKQTEDPAYVNYRWYWGTAFDYRSPEDKANGMTPQVHYDKESFKQRLLNVREIVCRIGKQTVCFVFKTKWQSQFPNFKYFGNRQVQTFEDFRECFFDIPQQERMGYAHFVLQECWGGNRWAIEAELWILDLLQWKYLNSNSKGITRLRRSVHGTIRSILIKTKGSVLSATEKFLKNKAHQNCRIRRQVTPKRPNGDKDDQCHLVKKQRRATFEQDGFNGFINDFVVEREHYLPPMIWKEMNGILVTSLLKTLLEGWQLQRMIQEGNVGDLLKELAINNEVCHILKILCITLVFSL